MTAPTHSRLDHDAAAQPAPPAAPPRPLAVPILGPVVFLLLFVYVFGGTLGNGITAGGRTRRLHQLPHPRAAPVHGRRRRQYHRDLGGQGHDRGHHRPLQDDANLAPAVLAGHVLGGLILTLISLAVVDRRRAAHRLPRQRQPARWLAAIGLLVLLAFALIWLTVAFGLIAKSVETASNMPMLLSSCRSSAAASCPVASMPAGLRWFAENQPFTPITDTVAACSPTSTSAAPA